MSVTFGGTLELHHLPGATHTAQIDGRLIPHYKFVTVN